MKAATGQGRRQQVPNDPPDMHIGLIVGIGPAATDFYYRYLISALSKAGRELTPRRLPTSR